MALVLLAFCLRSSFVKFGISLQIGTFEEVMVKTVDDSVDHIG